jgi:2-succinyl-6-hydroxy-2,4-cyclohexadiene-1-carboxylate synthase
MTLNAVVKTGNPALPWLVFVHGFSGNCHEWQPVGEQFSDYSRLYLDLPGHGDSAQISVADFTALSALVEKTLHSYNILKYWLIGYSLGGRVAMHFACQQPQGLQGLVVEGAHPGLINESERQQRADNDTRWAARFRHEPLAEVFTAWYQQPVFASLTAAQRRELVNLRQHNNGPALADMLESTSLARQPDLRAALRARTFPFYYLCGEHDAKFRAIGEEIAASPLVITAAGHNAHRDAPATVASALRLIIKDPQ